MLTVVTRFCVPLICLTLVASHLAAKDPAPAPPPLQLEIKRPKMVATCANLNSGEFEILAVFKNNTAAPIVVSPYLSLTLHDATGAEVKPSRKLGRFGRRSRGCSVAKLQFDTIAPGESLTRRVKTSRYMMDPQYILAWKLSEAGTYTLSFQYQHDAKALLARCPEACEGHDDKAADWNTAWVGPISAALELKVSE